MNPTKTIVDQAEAALRLFLADTREEAEYLLGAYGPLVEMFKRDRDAAAEVRHLVLSRFPAAEPPSVPGLDWLPEVEADAAAVVASLAVPAAEKVLPGLVSDACECGHPEDEHITGVCTGDLTHPEYRPCDVYMRAAS